MAMGCAWSSSARRGGWAQVDISGTINPSRSPSLLARLLRARPTDRDDRRDGGAARADESHLHYTDRGSRMTRAPYRITIVSHTHWDREWYKPFRCSASTGRAGGPLAGHLDSTPDYHSFLLDGQTIVLEDYLAIRPEREADLRRHIQAGRLLIGPGTSCPTSSGQPRATVRNLILGARSARALGRACRSAIHLTRSGTSASSRRFWRALG